VSGTVPAVSPVPRVVLYCYNLHVIVCLPNSAVKLDLLFIIGMELMYYQDNVNSLPCILCLARSTPLPRFHISPLSLSA
jgi:hypothetical protein